MTQGPRTPQPGTLYARTLGRTVADLPGPIRMFHEGGAFTGRAHVTRGQNPLARFIATLFGFPKAGSHDLKISVTTDPQGREHWSRIYSGRTMFSRQYAGAGRAEGCVIEQLGPVAVQTRLTLDEGKLRYRTQGWSLCGIPLPRVLAPGGDVYEAVDTSGRFTFHVDVTVPILGRLVHYEGWLTPKAPTPGQDVDHLHSP